MLLFFIFTYPCTQVLLMFLSKSIAVTRYQWSTERLPHFFSLKNIAIKLLLLNNRNDTSKCPWDCYFDTEAASSWLRPKTGLEAKFLWVSVYYFWNYIYKFIFYPCEVLEKCCPKLDLKCSEFRIPNDFIIPSRINSM